MKRVAVIGSTGSIGKNTLDVIAAMPRLFKAHALAVASNISSLEKQILGVRPKRVCVWDEKKAMQLKKHLGRKRVEVLAGLAGLLELVDDDAIDIYVFALSGTEGILPLLAALKKGKRVAIANKEPLVIAGSVIRDYVTKYGAELIPVDSEHSALFQCMKGYEPCEVERLIITASGGPFFDVPKEQFASITPARALQHPKWRMGKKITIDSATMMNKVLELLEAITLFGFSSDQIDIVVHPEAIVHSMVQFIDGSLLAQLAVADMRIPIQYALTYPVRMPRAYERVSFKKMRTLSFHSPDIKKFPTLPLGYRAANEGGTLPAVLNAADEVCVENFLREAISFVDIMKIIEKVMNKHCVEQAPSYEVIMAADAWAREEAQRLCLK